MWNEVLGGHLTSKRICRFGFGFKFTAGVSRDQNIGAWLWKLEKDRVRVHQTMDADLLTRLITAWFGAV